MKIVLFGYGKMGKEIEKIALSRGHEISLIIDLNNKDSISIDELKKADAAIEFTSPESAVNNIKKCFDAGLPVVVGTTGWYARFEEISNECLSKNATLLSATNFSIGVNLFFEMNRKLAQLMKGHKYDVKVEETHHVHKLDAPSGTAITTANDLIQHGDKKKSWTIEKPENSDQLEIVCHRIDEVPGTHVVNYFNEVDSIELKHTAFNRKGFAGGAVIAAEWIKGKKGIYSMKDVLGI